MNDKKFRLFTQALTGIQTPTLVLDLDAFEKNVAWPTKVLTKKNKKTIRLATKSIRSTAVLNSILESSSLYSGLMTYHLAEALWLKKKGFNNILMGYPSVDESLLAELAKSPEHVTLMVDRIEHLILLETLAKSKRSYFNICIDIDLS
jgi:D-serine deaminase-like pyridoxal phosphate-dependent protein